MVWRQEGAAVDRCEARPRRCLGWTELSFSRCLLLISRRSRLLSFRGRVSQGQADEVIRAAFLAFLAAPRRRLVRCWNGQNGWQVADLCCCLLLLAAAALFCCFSFHWKLLLFRTCGFWHPSIAQGQGGRYNDHCIPYAMLTLWCWLEEIRTIRTVHLMVFPVTNTVRTRFSTKLVGSRGQREQSMVGPHQEQH